MAKYVSKGISVTQYSKPSGNPKRNNGGRYCSGKKPTNADGKEISEKGILSSNGKPVKTPEKNKISKLSSELTQLRKEAKTLGIDRVNSYDKASLKEAIAKAKAENKPEEASAEANETEVNAIRAEIKEKGGNLPRGRRSRDIDALKEVLKGLE